MFIYMAAVITIVVFSFLMLVYISKKNKFYDIRLILATTVSSVIISLVFPWIYSLFLETGIAGSIHMNKVLAVGTAVVANIILIFIFTILISSFISERTTKTISDALKGKVAVSVADIKKTAVGKLNKRPKDDSEEDEEHHCSVNVAEQNEQNTGKIFGEAECEQQKEDLNTDIGIAADEAMKEDTSEVINEYISEDTQEDISKGISEDISEDTHGDTEGEGLLIRELEAEQNEISAGLVKGSSYSTDFGSGQPEGVSNTMSTEVKKDLNQYMLDDSDNKKESVVGDYIDKAFALKESGDLEGAILSYMYALEKVPEGDLLFWIIIDICSLYKDLGKADLAKDILESYASSYSHLMNEAVKLEIERNLSYV